MDATNETPKPQPVPQDRGQEKALADLRSLLIEGEKLETSAIQRRIFALTHRRVIVAATSGRLISVARGLIGGFSVKDFRWQDLRDAQVRVGIIGATLSISVYGTSDLASGEGPETRLVFSGLRKDEAQEVYRVCQFQEQAWREKRRVRDLEELRAKSGGVHLESGAALTSPPADGEGSSPEARLERAKGMLEKGLISDAEFEQIKSRILSNL